MFIAKRILLCHQNLNTPENIDICCLNKLLLNKDINVSTCLS
jgi:hypothetical protein